MRIIIGFSTIVLVLIGSIYLLIGDNFHPVIPGEIYRSAQLTTDSLEQYAQEKNLKSVLNLRGANPGEEWYRAEKIVSSRLGIDLFDLQLRAFKLPSIVKLRRLLEVLERIPRPYLLHCEGGSDRAGFVSTLLLLDEGKQSMSEIEKHVSWRYLAIKEDSVGKLFFEKYQTWLDARDLEHNPSRFSNWLQNGYRDQNGNLGFFMDGINGVLSELNQQEEPIFNIPRQAGASLEINGWAVDHGSESLISGIEVLIYRKPAQSARYGISRPDVSSYFGNPEYDNSGWHLEFDQDSLADGCHPMQLRITRLDGSVWQSATVASLCIQG